jgi:molybdopterin molybdotransferase
MEEKVIMISVEKALQIVLECTPILDTTMMPVLEARYMALAEDVISPDDIPSFDMAMIDGFAVRSEDTTRAFQSAPIMLKLDGEIKVGCPWQDALQPGHALRIASGCPLPEGADAIIPSEDAVRETAGKVKIYKGQKAGENIFIKGSDIAAGSPVLNKGKVLTGADIGVLAAIGRQEVQCYRRPRVSFFASGNDLIPCDQPLVNGKIRAGNTFILQSQLAEYGAEPVNLGITGADSNAVKAIVEKAVCSDMFITSVGSSLEDFDFLKNILQRVGMDLKFWRVAIRPGKPLIFGTYNGKPVFGLPGNCLSSIVILEEFVRPAILKMQGKRDVRRIEVHAKLEKDVKGGGGMTHFIRAEVRVGNDGFLAVPIGSRSTPSVMPFATANGFIVIPQDINYLAAGELARVQIISDPASGMQG